MANPYRKAYNFAIEASDILPRNCSTEDIHRWLYESVNDLEYLANEYDMARKEELRFMKAKEKGLV